ncbi:EAL domain-containing protein [Sporosarcina sp. CAU 1771]
MACSINEVNELCHKLGMNPEKTLGPLTYVSQLNLSDKIEEYEEIISVTKFFSNKILDLLADTPLEFLVTDHNGVILSVFGDNMMRIAAKTLGVQPGYEISIPVMGTNAISLALLNDCEPIQVLGDQHFLQRFHDCACYGIAFKDIETNKIIGTLAIMTTLEHHNPLYPAMLSTVSDSIERELLLRKKNKELNILNQVMMDNNLYCVLVTNAKGEVVEFNSSAENLLDMSSKDVIGSNISNLDPIGGYALKVINEKASYKDVQITISKDETKNVCLLDAFPVYDDKCQVIGAFSQIRDITELFEIQQKINYLANHDEKTGLPNRRLLTEKLIDLLDVNKNPIEKNKFALIHIDLDRFKLVNDTLGHTKGDVFLKRISIQLENILDPEDFISRVGGDEFIIVKPFTKEKDLTLIDKRLSQVFSHPLSMGNFEFHITASSGIAIYPDDSLLLEDLFVKADTAMFHAKKMGKNQIVYYSEKLDSKSKERTLLDSSLRKAIEKEEFVLFYQPQVEVATGLINGVEVLIRWKHPEKGLMYPMEFIPNAEESGLIIEIDKWVLRAACIQNKKWQDDGLPPFRIAVNISAKKFASRNLVQLVRETLVETGLRPEYLEIEITETMMMDVEHAIPILNGLQELGVYISIDDFGTGYSSLSYLSKFNINRLKIDRSFIQNIEKGESDANIVALIIQVAHNLELEAVAEGVENDKQLQFLRLHSCDVIQGFYYSKPISAEELETRFVEIQRDVIEL